MNSALSSARMQPEVIHPAATRRWWPLASFIVLPLLAGALYVGFGQRAPRHRIAINTSLPLIWGTQGGDVSGILKGESKPAPVYQWLKSQHDMVPVDRFDGLAQDKVDLLLLAHPGAMAPQQLVDIDAFVRGGGHALILADALSSWEPPFPLGDRRNPPITTLLTPMLTHWGITLDTARDGDTTVTLPDAGQMRLRSAGGFTYYPEQCRALSTDAGKGAPAIITCQIGKGRAVLVGDADWIGPPYWTGATDDAPRADQTKALQTLIDLTLTDAR